jgi:uncharacterized repeat protein (TIGR04138 family)
VGDFKDWQTLRTKAGPFPPQAYQFVREGLAHTVKLVHGDTMPGMSEDESRHVTGQQLCMGLRDFAVRQYGLLAKTVLSNWGIRATEDFGRIVFAMIEAGLMRKTEEDTMEDFCGVFDFDDAFGDLPIKS